MRAKILLLDSDTLIKWIFNADREHPVITKDEALDDGYARYVPFPAVADVYLAGRCYASILREDPDGGEEKARAFEQELGEILFRWFHELLFVVHAEEVTSKDWLGLACAPPIHENANREHLWLAAIARTLGKHHNVSIASEEPDVYIEMRDLGHLEEIRILT